MASLRDQIIQGAWEWAASSSQQFLLSFGWAGLVLLFAGGVLAFSLAMHGVRLAQEPRGMAVAAGLVALAIGWMWWHWGHASGEQMTGGEGVPRLTTPKLDPKAELAALKETPKPVASVKEERRKPSAQAVTQVLPPVLLPPPSPFPVAMLLRASLPHLRPIIVGLKKAADRHIAAHPAQPQPKVNVAAVASARPQPSRSGPVPRGIGKPKAGVGPLAGRQMTPAQQRQMVIREQNRIAANEMDRWMSGMARQQGISTHPSGMGHLPGVTHHPAKHR